MTGLTWHQGDGGVVAAEIAGTTIAVVYATGWWSSYLLNGGQPCTDLDDGKAQVEAAWAAWMDRAGLAWAARAPCRSGQTGFRDRAVAACQVSAQDLAEGGWGPEGRAMAQMLRERIAAIPCGGHDP